MDYVIHLVQMVVSLAVKDVKVVVRQHVLHLVVVVVDKVVRVHVS